MKRAFWNRSILGGSALPEGTPDSKPVTYSSDKTNGPLASGD
jgi:hypothetical protein